MTSEEDRLPRAVSLTVHELRTPVTVVGGYLRMLLREQAGPLNDRQRKMLEEADRSCGRLGAIVAELSEFGKLEAGTLALARQDFDLGAAIAAMAGGMHEGSDRDVHLDLRLGDDALPVTGDQARISAALGALMRSALRERGEPGSVAVVCSRLTGPATPGAWALVAVGDDADLPRLTACAGDPPDGFDEWRGGLGLALPVARRVIEAHGGAIWSVEGARSRAAAGLRLPLRS